MREKKRINTALARLAAATDSGFSGPRPQKDQDAFEHLKQALGRLDVESVAEAVSAFRGSWLHALYCMAQELPFEGQVIVPACCRQPPR